MYCDVVYYADPIKNGISTILQHVSLCEKNPSNQNNNQTQIIFYNREIDEAIGKTKATLLA